MATNKLASNWSIPNPIPTLYRNIITPNWYHLLVFVRLSSGGQGEISGGDNGQGGMSGSRAIDAAGVMLGTAKIAFRSVASLKGWGDRPGWYPPGVTPEWRKTVAEFTKNSGQARLDT